MTPSKHDAKTEMNIKCGKYKPIREHTLLICYMIFHNFFDLITEMPVQGAMRLSLYTEGSRIIWERWHRYNHSTREFI